MVAARTVNDTVVRAHIGADIQLFDGDLGRVWQPRIGGKLQVKQKSGFQAAVRNLSTVTCRRSATRADFASMAIASTATCSARATILRPSAARTSSKANKEDQCSQLELSPPGPPPGDGAPPPDDGATPPSDGVLPSNEFSFGKVKKNKRKGTAKLPVSVALPPGVGTRVHQEGQGSDGAS